MSRFVSFVVVLLFSCVVCATQPFRVAQLTDLHISRSNPKPLEDLRRSIDDINYQLSTVNSDTPPIAFVLVCGDVTEAGDKQSMEAVKAELDRLEMPYYITSGNHETTWSESGCTDFPRVFGSDRFSFVYDDICFIGFNSGPRLKMSDGHVVPQDLTWAKHILDSLPKNHKVVGVTHYPLQEGDVDNWYEVTDLFRQYNTQFFVGGHYHRNLLFNADGISDVLCRSNLRGRAETNGYTILSFTADSVVFAEKITDEAEAIPWLTLPLQEYDYRQIAKLPRPSFNMNNPSFAAGAEEKHLPEEIWRVQVGVGIYNSAATDGENAYVADDEGNLHAYSLFNGDEVWSTDWGYKKARICGMPLAADGYVIVANTNGEIISMRKKGLADHTWTLSFADDVLPADKKAFLGCPVYTKVDGKKMVLVGGNGIFLALTPKGKIIWTAPIEGYCVTRPCVYDNKVYFGTWGCYFYALDIRTGRQVWRWSNGSTNDKFSPAAVWPVATDNKVFIVAPDRYMTCLNAQTGEQMWRTNQHKVRENIGMSQDEERVFARCMNDSVVAINALSDTLELEWKVSADYGYDHNPSMMIEMDRQIVFGTKNGVLYGIDSDTGKVLWRYKVSNCLINTICPVTDDRFLVTSSDGSVLLMELPYIYNR